MTFDIHLLTKDELIEQWVETKLQEFDIHTTSVTKTMRTIGSEPITVVLDFNSFNASFPMVVEKAIESEEPCYVVIISDQSPNLERKYEEFIDWVSTNNLGKLRSVLMDVHNRITYEYKIKRDFANAKKSGIRNSDRSSTIDLEEERRGENRGLTHKDFTSILIRAFNTKDKNSGVDAIETTWGNPRSPAVAICELISTVESVPPQQLPPLYDKIETDALNNLFPTSSDIQYMGGKVSFQYFGYQVTVYSHGKIEIRPPS